MKRNLFLMVIAILAITKSSAIESCINGCKCQEDISLTRKLRIVDCQNPIVLNNRTIKTKSKSINIIHFENVIIHKIENGAFNNFKDLETITIKNSNIGTIDSSAIDMPELGTISFTGTSFKQIPLLKSDYLEELLINNCNLQQLPNLDGLPSLILLSLTDNNITELNVNAFLRLENLEEINVVNNSIFNLPPDIFNNNSALNTLYLDNNPIKSFQLNTVSNLELLSMKSCKLITFNENSSKNLDVVSHLDLSNNNISILPIDAFTDMTELSFIDLSNNNLTEISDNIFEDNIKLYKIVLDSNRFKKLPKFQSADKIFQTYFFSCNNCNLNNLDEATFENMPAIISLRLSNNNISNIEFVFDKIRSLKELDLSNNRISKINLNTFSKNTALETLNLSGNPLKPLDPTIFVNINALKKLDASNSGLTQLWSNRNVNLPSLERLLIGRNQLKQLTIKDLTVTPNVKLLDLEENPLKCSQDLHDLVLWLIKESVYPIQGADKLKTHESLITKDATSFEETFDQESSWKKLALHACGNKNLFDDEIDIETKNNDITHYEVEAKTEKNDDEYYDDYDYSYDEDESKIKKDDSDINIFNEESVLNRNINLARASYILSITSVFVLTALVVLTVAVSLTLIILRRHGALNMHNNFPRIKIPLWNSTLGQKKHSGSVYRPLSEDLSGSKTPIISRYEFKTTPIVHNTTIP